MTKGRRPGFRIWALYIGAALAILALRPASADIFNFGDVMISTNFGSVYQYDHDLNYIRSLEFSAFHQSAGSTFDNAGNFYLTGVNSAIAKVDSTGNLVSPSYFTGGAAYASILYSRSGAFYAGDGKSKVISQFAAGGGLPTTTFTVKTEINGPLGVEDTGTDWIDLAANGTTFYYTSGGSHVLRKR